MGVYEGRVCFSLCIPYPLYCDILCLPIQLCARALVKMEAPVQLQTPAHVLQDGVEHSAQQVLCSQFSAHAYSLCISLCLSLLPQPFPLILTSTFCDFYVAQYCRDFVKYKCGIDTLFTQREM